jgi:3-phosphoshikimate 1-carboxyvinyltransferase
LTDVVVRSTKSLIGRTCSPSSKAYTQRMVISAALSSGISKLSNPLVSEDTEATVRAVKALGARVRDSDACWIIEGTGIIKGATKPINCGESGATLRFMIPVAALASEPSVFLLGKGLSKRPIDPLIQSLKQLGSEVHVEKVRGKTRVVVQGGGIRGGKTSMPGDVSSQFVSGLMFACPLSDSDTQLTLTSTLESKSYVLMTENVLSKHGIEVDISEDFSRVKIRANQLYRPVEGRAPGDFSSASFLLAAAALTQSKVHVENLDYKTIQGDKAILQILKQMGVNGKICENEIEIEGSGNLLNPINVDARDIPDLVPVCAAMACYANGTTEIHDAERLRFKESDRLSSICSELRKMGANMSINESSLSIKGPCKLKGAIIDPHNDHRIAMACAVAALGAEGETLIQNAECVRKSYPDFFIDLQKLGADVVGGKFYR